jgi:hypothetical protein
MDALMTSTEDSRSPRSVKRSLASIVLGFEIIVVFLGALVINGLQDLSPLLVLGGGGLLCLIMVAIIGLLNFPGAYLAGWVVQIIVIATGFLNPSLFFVGALFAAMWAYAMVAGNRIDHQKEIA